MYMHELKEKLCEELEEIARKPEMSAGDLEAAHKLPTPSRTSTRSRCWKRTMGTAGPGTGRPICAVLMPAAPATVAGSGIPWDVIAGMEDILDTHLLT